MRPSIGWQLGFLRGFLGGKDAKAAPFAMLVDVTVRCNLHCLHCHWHSPLVSSSLSRPEATIEDFPLDLFIRLCREARELGIQKVILIGGGEPLLHPGITEMVAYASEAGCQVVLLTNGTCLESGHAVEFMRTGLDELRVSLWASNEEEYRAQYPGSNTALFHRAIEGVKSFVAERKARETRLPRVVLHRPIEPRFIHSLEGTLDIARATGCDAISFSPLKPLLPRHIEQVYSDDVESEVLNIIGRIGRKAESLGLTHNTKEVLWRYRIGRAVWEKIPCYIGWVDIRVRVNGDVVPCDTCHWVLGNVHRAGIGEIWNGPAYEEFRRVSRRRDGIMQSGQNCICDFCCHAVTNARLHRILRWVSPAALALQVVRG